MDYLNSLNDQISDLKLNLNSMGISDNININLNLEHFSADICKTSLQSPDRFLVNFYKRPSSSCLRNAIMQSNGFKLNLNKTIMQPEKNKLWPVRDKCDKDIFCNNNDNIQKTKLTMDQFLNLKNQRDIECTRMKEASKVLQLLNNHSRYGYWFEKLLAEKVLLRSGEAVELLINKIRDDCDYTLEETLIGTITLSNFKFHSIKNQPNSNEVEFFILLLSSDIEVKVSKIARCVSGEIIFDEKFTFQVDHKFNIKLKLFSIIMKEPPKFLNLITKSLRRKKSGSISKLLYKNLNTCDVEESQVLKTSFKLCAESEITPTNFREKHWKLVLAKPDFEDSVSLVVALGDFKIVKRRSGFFNFGYPFEDGLIWNRRWCVLDGHFMKVYNSPSEEGIIDSQLILNLMQCASDQIDVAPRILCNRSKSFMVDINSGNDKIMRYFFMADNSQDLNDWLNDLNLVLDLIKYRKSILS